MCPILHGNLYKHGYDCTIPPLLNILHEPLHSRMLLVFLPNPNLLLCVCAYMCQGCKVFKQAKGPVSKVFIQLVMTCTG